MLTGSLNSGYGYISVFYKQNDNKLADSLYHITTGKRVNKPQESIPDYFHAENHNRQAKQYTGLRQGVAEALNLVQVASNAGESVFNDLDRMRDLVDLYYNDITDPEDRNAIKAEFSSLRSQVQFGLDNSTYDGKKLIQDTGAGSLKSVNIDTRDVNVTLDISFTGEQVADVSSLSLGNATHDEEADAVQAELNKAGSYLAKLSAYSQGLHSQYNIMSKQISASQKVSSSLTDADTGKEYADVMNLSIKGQSTLAMMAQANIMKTSILKLMEM